MIQYIYFVKCPNCADEHFDFFDEAKEFALSCLSQKPIITQTEVCRNDFGECTGSADLGTVWSWEDMMGESECGYTEADPAISIFTKDNLKRMADSKDPEFDELDNSVDFKIDEIPDNFRKPIPDGMTIEQLVEAMEENEDTVECVCCQELYPKEDCKYDEKHGWICSDCQDEVVECTWCEELYDRSECRYEVDLGWLCDRCEAAIKSRGETLTFRENNYWDFLDEDADSDNAEDSLEEAVLTEAGKNLYDFTYISQQADAKQQILDALKTELSPLYFNGNELKNITAVYPSYGMTAKIQDFSIYPADDTNPFGLITVQCKNERDGKVYSDFLKDAFDGIRRDCAGNKFLMALRNVASSLNNQYKPALRERNRANTLAALKENPEITSELLGQLSKIEFLIPLIGDPAYAQDFESAKVKDGADFEPLSQEAREKLEQIYYDFAESETGKKAFDAGIVVNRPSHVDTNYNIESCWGAAAKVTFKCPISKLSAEAKEVLKDAKIFKKGDDASANTLDDGKNFINSYRLANALVLLGALDTTVGDQRLTASFQPKSMLEELEDADTYGARLVQCPECGKTTFDPETEMCGNCGFNTFDLEEGILPGLPVPGLDLL